MPTVIRVAKTTAMHRGEKAVLMAMSSEGSRNTPVSDSSGCSHTTRSARLTSHDAAGQSQLCVCGSRTEPVEKASCRRDAGAERSRSSSLVPGVLAGSVIHLETAGSLRCGELPWEADEAPTGSMAPAPPARGQEALQVPPWPRSAIPGCSRSPGRVTEADAAHAQAFASAKRGSDPHLPFAHRLLVPLGLVVAPHRVEVLL